MPIRVFHTFGSGLNGARYQLKPCPSHLLVCRGEGESRIAHGMRANVARPTATSWEL